MRVNVTLQWGLKFSRIRKEDSQKKDAIRPSSDLCVSEKIADLRSGKSGATGRAGFGLE